MEQRIARMYRRDSTTIVISMVATWLVLAFVLREVLPHEILQFLQRIGCRLPPPARLGRGPEMDVTDDLGIAVGKRQEFGNDVFVQAAYNDG